MHKVHQLLHWFKRKAPPKEVFEKIQCPTLIFLATEDRAVSPDDAAKQVSVSSLSHNAVR